MSGLSVTLADLIAKQRQGYPLDAHFYRDPEIFERDMENYAAGFVDPYLHWIR